MIRTIYPSARRAAICSAVLLLFLAATLTAWKPAAAMTTVTAAPPAAWGAPSEPGAPVTGNVAIAQLKANGQYGALKKAIAAAIPAISQQAYLKASSTGASNEFGYAVAISGNTAVVGAPFEGSSGAAYVFVRSGAGWAQQAVLKASNSGLDDWFGSAVAISGDTIVVGAPNEDSTATGVNGGGSDNSASNSGAAYVYVRSGTNWTQEAYLKASNTGVDDLFGSAVAISGDTVVVGASFESSTATGVNNDGSDNSASHSGAAYVFVRNGESWAHQAYLKASNTEANDWFGFAVAISGDTVVVGAQFEDSTATGVNGDGSDNSKSNAGAAYVFVRSGESWAQQAYLKASNSGVGDEFGSSVAISGDTIVVGARFEDSAATGVNGDDSDNSASNSGAAYVFVRSGASWAQQAYLKAGNSEKEDWFGGAVAISGDTVVVAAQAEPSAATGVNGDGSDNSAAGAGAAYVYVRSSGNWTQQDYLKASNTETQDVFGYAVAISHDNIVVGAPYEDSASTSVNGDGSDNSMSAAGAAYIFGGPPVQLQVAVNGNGSVKSEPTGIDCGITCTAQFVAGTPVTLTATAGVTATFAGWSGACTGTGTCAVTMDAAKQVTATFAVQSNPLTATLTSQYVGQYITYTLMVTNTGAAPQQVTSAGSLPADSDLVSSSGSFQPGGDFGTGLVTLNVPALGPGASSSLVWVVKMRDAVGDIVSNATVSNETLNLRLNATNKIYRVFLMKLFKEGSLTQ